MPYSRLSHLDNCLQADEIIDLDAFEQDERCTPTPAMDRQPHNYRISFRSIDDDELLRLTRTLITPMPPSVTEEDPSGFHYASRQRQRRYSPETVSSTAKDRSESVMLFKKINDGDEETVIDLVSSDLHDFIDPAVFNAALSRPSSRVPTRHDIHRRSPLRHPKRDILQPIPILQLPSDKKRTDQLTASLTESSSSADATAPRPTPSFSGRKFSLDASLSSAAAADNMTLRRSSVADPTSIAAQNQSVQKTRQLLDIVEASYQSGTTTHRHHHNTTTTSPSATLLRRQRSYTTNEKPRSTTTSRPSPLPASSPVAKAAKRQSLDVDALISLRRDSDALLERRYSLLKVRTNRLLNSHRDHAAGSPPADDPLCSSSSSSSCSPKPFHTDHTVAPMPNTNRESNASYSLRERIRYSMAQQDEPFRLRDRTHSMPEHQRQDTETLSAAESTARRMRAVSMPYRDDGSRGQRGVTTDRRSSALLYDTLTQAKTPNPIGSPRGRLPPRHDSHRSLASYASDKSSAQDDALSSSLSPRLLAKKLVPLEETKYCTTVTGRFPLARENSKERHLSRPTLSHQSSHTSSSASTTLSFLSDNSSVESAPSFPSSDDPLHSPPHTSTAFDTFPLPTSTKLKYWRPFDSKNEPTTQRDSHLEHSRARTMGYDPAAHEESPRSSMRDSRRRDDMHRSAVIDRENHLEAAYYYKSRMRSMTVDQHSKLNPHLRVSDDNDDDKDRSAPSVPTTQSVTKSAKQVLATIRQRRRSALIQSEVPVTSTANRVTDTTLIKTRRKTLSGEELRPSTLVQSMGHTTTKPTSVRYSSLRHEPAEHRYYDPAKRVNRTLSSSVQSLKDESPQRKNHTYTIPQSSLNRYSSRLPSDKSRIAFNVPSKLPQRSSMFLPPVSHRHPAS
ncbi:uncharacterized protein BYT42DRAFT_566080 [Radiomyces spectabilis]|uniref:uncharacterized protein n=1 Tax=Radiomyces spectabilis TaxID=64574 RepID=UPI00222094AA|nr:uncharacterized protein BYT42DRAFT_566080 [Radiomyces spectabilis]KAI8381312.1 hypothetical protein BYT42DRAFT_566080 [Radiomyces spectabilis]